MASRKNSPGEVAFFNLAQAQWVVGVLSMLIAVVGKESLLGLLLGQTCSEIRSLVRADRRRGYLEIGEPPG